ncbi:hypothetical protein LTR53_010013 [Teratosphaeriaceae sp. CCFEE 6253]|nr:hypothetical protein LTR53_010013 [Teratosphaeriaceae sp. CCFEE 6253]
MPFNEILDRGRRGLQIVKLRAALTSPYQKLDTEHQEIRVLILKAGSAGQEVSLSDSPKAGVCDHLIRLGGFNQDAQCLHSWP